MLQRCLKFFPSWASEFTFLFSCLYFWACSQIPSPLHCIFLLYLPPTLWNSLASPAFPSLSLNLQLPFLLENTSQHWQFLNPCILLRLLFPEYIFIQCIFLLYYLLVAKSYANPMKVCLFLSPSYKWKKKQAMERSKLFVQDHMACEHFRTKFQTHMVLMCV